MIWGDFLANINLAVIKEIIEVFPNYQEGSKFPCESAKPQPENTAKQKIITDYVSLSPSIFFVHYWHFQSALVLNIHKTQSGFINLKKYDPDWEMICKVSILKVKTSVDQ